MFGKSVIREQAQGLIGSQRAAYSGQNVLVDDGTALAMVADTALLAELDVLELGNNAMKEAWGFRTQANILKFEGDIAARIGRIRAYNTLITTSSQLALTASNRRGQSI